MHRFTSRRPSAAMVVATVALVAALGGTGYAATSLPANSVGTTQLKSGAVTSVKLGQGSVQAANLGTDSVTKRAMAAGSVGSPEILDNSIAPRDLQVGAVTVGTIAPGAVINSKIGSSAITNSKIGNSQVSARNVGTITVRSASATITASTTSGAPTKALVTARCLSGEKALGIGSSWNGATSDAVETDYVRFLTTSAGAPTGAVGRGSSNVTVARVFTVQVSCLR